MKDLVLHIGLMKSGTTSVQRTLHETRRDLISRSVDYVDLGQFNQMLAFVPLLESDPHARARFAAGLKTHLAENTADLRALWEQLVVRVRESKADRLVLSAENLVYAGEQTIGAIAESFPSHSIRVVVTHRQPSKLVPSNYQQQARIARVGEFDAWARNELCSLAADVPSRSLSSLRLCHLTSLWEPHVSSVELIHVGNDVDAALDRMWHALTGVSAFPPRKDGPRQQNPSMPAEFVEAIQRWFARPQKYTVSEVREIVHLAQQKYLNTVGGPAFRWQLAGPVADWLDMAYLDPGADWQLLLPLLDETPALGELVSLRPANFEEHVQLSLKEVERAARATGFRRGYRTFREALRSIT